MIDPPTSATRRHKDGTWVIGVGAVLASVGAYTFQVVSGRSLGVEAFAPVAALWTMGFLIHTVLMFPVEQVIARRLVVSGRTDLRSAVPGHAVVVLLSSVGGGSLLVALTLDRFYGGEPAFVAAMTLLALSRALMTIGRGRLAGEGRYVSYGVSLLIEAATLALLGVVIASAGGSSVMFGFGIAVAPISILLVQPFRSSARRESTSVLGPSVSQRPTMLAMLLLSSAVAQTIIAGGPLIVGLIGGSSAAVSVYFVTFTLLRGPVTASYGLATRLLADLSALAARGRMAELRMWARRSAAAGAGGSAVLGVAGFFGVPAIVEFLYGSGFRPTALVAGLGSAGVGVALTLLASSQVLVALGTTRDLAAGWGLGLLAATVVVVAGSGDQVLLVAEAFLAGEIVAFCGITTATFLQTRTRPTLRQQSTV